MLTKLAAPLSQKWVALPLELYLFIKTKKWMEPIEKMIAENLENTMVLFLQMKEV